MRTLKKILVVAFSVGWVAPMWLATWLFVDFWQVEGWPHLLGQQSENSFEWFGPTKSCLNLGFAMAAYELTQNVHAICESLLGLWFALSFLLVAGSVRARHAA